MQANSTLCECGCGRLANPGRRFVFGHQGKKSPIEYVVEDRGYKTPCWIWQGATSKGYGRVKVNRRCVQAHEVFFVRKYGPVPSGTELDHLCRVRECVNPDHLEPVPHAENTRRGMAAIYGKTCRNGHPKSPENIYVYAPTGAKHCRACNRERMRQVSRLLLQPNESIPIAVTFEDPGATAE